MAAPVVSGMFARRFCGLLAVTVTGVGMPVEPLRVSPMLVGGQVKKYPAAEVVPESVALITVEPGRWAVASPFTGLVLVVSLVLLIVTIVELTGVYVTVPTY